MYYYICYITYSISDCGIMELPLQNYCASGHHNSKADNREEYSFNTGEITKVVRRVNINSGIGTMAKITIYTKSKHVSVESLMRGCDKMDSYITENVDPQKIITKEKIWNANKTDY